MEVLDNLHLKQWATCLDEYLPFLVYEIYANLYPMWLRKMALGSIKIYVREHFVALSASMITDLFSLLASELPTLFED